MLLVTCFKILLFQFAYIFIAFYTFMASLFMLWKFTAMRLQFSNDLHLLTGIKLNRSKVEPMKVDAQAIQDQYFDQLRMQWS